MIIKIALGVVLGVFLLIAALILAAVICTGIAQVQDRIDRPQRRIHVRIRPEADNYKHMQELKRRARKAHPERWEEEEDED